MFWLATGSFLVSWYVVFWIELPWSPRLRLVVEANDYNAASKMNKVPRKTLNDRVKGNVKHGRKPGVGTVLTAEEENSLEQYLVYMAKCGFPLTRTMVKGFAWAIAKHVGKDDRFNKDYGPTDY